MICPKNLIDLTISHQSISLKCNWAWKAFLFSCQMKPLQDEYFRWIERDFEKKLVKTIRYHSIWGALDII